MRLPYAAGRVCDHVQLTQEPGIFIEAHEPMRCTAAAGAPTSRETRAAATSNSATSIGHRTRTSYLRPHAHAWLMRVRPVARRTCSRPTRCDGVQEAHKEAVVGIKMMLYCAATLDPCPTCHPWAACAISLQARAFSWPATRLDQLWQNCLRTPCREGSRGSLFGHPA